MLAETKKLEFDKILLKLRDYTQTDLAKQEVLQLFPYTDKQTITKLLNETEQAKIIIQRYDRTPMTGVLNLKEALKKAKIGSALTIEELMRVISHAEAIGRTATFIKKIKQLELACDSLVEYYDQIESIQPLKQAIKEVIDNKGNIYDNASQKLASIRKKLKINEEKINQKMASLLRSEQNKLTETLITIRNNRLVLPVKAEHKNTFKGIVYDQSASGETVYMEPLSCFDLNNEIQSLRVEEQNEIERILLELTYQVDEYGDIIARNLEIFTYLDIVFAKAKYAVDGDFNKPEIVKGEFELINARHPLIPKEQVVGNNIKYANYRHIIITGPNTGGKTVAIKTFGLLQIMLQSGMLIPVDMGSKALVFTNIFADIGDEQSIEQSLSTFSSHISKIIYILKNAKPKSLILLDELGSGTDPKEGASLAMSILNHIRKIDVYSMVTTHYPELKTYAYDLDDVQNASVEFDLKTLKPTYHLKIGIPGSSNAIQIASRLGLPDAICEDAKSVSLTFDTDVSKLIHKLEKQSLELDKEIAKYKQEKDNIKEKEKQLEKLYVDERINQNKLLKKLEAEKRETLESLKQEALDLIDELNDMKNNAGFKEHELAEKKYAAKNLKTGEDDYIKVSQDKIETGDTVKVIAYQRNGVINKEVGKGKFEVQMGALTLTCTEDQLEFISKHQPEEKPFRKSIKQSESNEQVKVELDLRGQRYEEAMATLDKFVDDCLRHNLEFAYIIHGYGTGALKKGVEEYVKINPQIKSSRPGGQNEGGKGVTVIYFK